jgi:hypothetical protein
MTWDLGIRALGLLAAMSLGFGVLAALIAGGSLRRRLEYVAVAWVVAFAWGLFTSEVWFGWATEEELQPNIDGLSYDEVLLSGIAMSVAVGLVMRYVRRRGHRHLPTGGSHAAR